MNGQYLREYNTKISNLHVQPETFRLIAYCIVLFTCLTDLITPKDVDATEAGSTIEDLILKLAFYIGEFEKNKDKRNLGRNERKKLVNLMMWDTFVTQMEIIVCFGCSWDEVFPSFRMAFHLSVLRDVA